MRTGDRAVTKVSFQHFRKNLRSPHAAPWPIECPDPGQRARLRTEAGGGGSEGIPATLLNAPQHAEQRHCDTFPLSVGFTITRHPSAVSFSDTAVGQVLPHAMQVVMAIRAIPSTEKRCRRSGPEARGRGARASRLDANHTPRRRVCPGRPSGVRALTPIETLERSGVTVGTWGNPAQGRAFHCGCPEWPFGVPAHTSQYGRAGLPPRRTLQRRWGSTRPFLPLAEV